MFDKIIASLKENGTETAWTLHLRDGDETVQIQACLPYGQDAVTDASSVEYLLFGGSCWASHLSGEPENVQKHLDHVQEIRDSWYAEAARLKTYLEQHKTDWTGDESYDFYSDWHKDVFGYRPRGWNYDPLGNAPELAKVS